MTDTPERIWAWKDSEYDATLWNDHGDKRYTPLKAAKYIRADLVHADAELAKQHHAEAFGAGVDSAAPKVKPLVWDKHPDEQEWYSKLPEIDGDTFERGYMILPARSHFTLYDGFCARRRVLGHFTTVGEAKDYAKDVNERRILSALE